MLRRTPFTSIREFNFGHPPLSKFFGPKVSAERATTPVDAGIKTSTLDNGVKIVTHDQGGATAAFGFYVDAGPKYDPAAVPGLSYVMRFALPTSSVENSLFQFDRTMRAHGMSYGSGEVRKRHLVWKSEGRRDMIAKPFEVLGTCVAVPRFHEADVERFRDTMDNQLEELRWQNPRDYCVDQLECVAFYKEPLGNPRMVWPTSNGAANHKALVEQWASYFVPQRVVVAGLNVDHDELVAAYNNLPFPHSKSAPHHAKAGAISAHKPEPQQYCPGKQKSEVEARATVMGTSPDMESDAIVALGWLAGGRDADVMEFAASAVAHQLVNAALEEVLQYERTAPLKGARGFYRPFSAAGLLGFTARESADGITPLVRETITVVKSLKPNDVAILGGRARALVAFNDELERSADYLDFLGTSTQSADAIQKAIKEVPVESVKKALEAVQKGVPCLFATGDVAGIPSIRQLGWN